MSKLDKIHEEMTKGMDCRNPECRNGFTPGIITAGKGTANMPLLGATMRWGWVKCRACNPDKDHPYQATNRSSAEIAERARLADAKSEYKKTQPPDRSNLEKLAATTPAPQQSAAQPELVNRLLDQVSKLTDQVTELLQENRELREELKTCNRASVVEVAPPRKKVIKKRGAENDPSNSTKDKRALS